MTKAKVFPIPSLRTDLTHYPRCKAQIIRRRRGGCRVAGLVKPGAAERRGGVEAAIGRRETLLNGANAVREFPPLAASETEEERKTLGVPSELGSREGSRDPAGPGGEKEEEILAKIGSFQVR